MWPGADLLIYLRAGTARQRIIPTAVEARCIRGGAKPPLFDLTARRTAVVFVGISVITFLFAGLLPVAARFDRDISAGSITVTVTVSRAAARSVAIAVAAVQPA
jgi:hypothetical protein